MFDEPTYDSDDGTNAVRSFAEAMTLVREEYVFHRHSSSLQALYYLFGLDYGYIGVVGTMQHNRRSFHTVDFVDGREFAQHIGLSIGVSVLNLRDRAHPGYTLGKERLEVDDTEEIRASSKDFRKLGQSRHGHVATIGASHDADALRVCNA